ncbi:MAG: hypothetical protein D6E12_04140 [Desulfovibrio sp.]|nr:MAG: hypothetical protein D6E12_04140 [Desulfovibrio sp.]
MDKRISAAAILAMVLVFSVAIFCAWQARQAQQALAEVEEQVLALVQDLESSRETSVQADSGEIVRLTEQVATLEDELAGVVMDNEALAVELEQLGLETQALAEEKEALRAECEALREQIRQGQAEDSPPEGLGAIPEIIGEPGQGDPEEDDPEEGETEEDEPGQENGNQ